MEGLECAQATSCDAQVSSHDLIQNVQSAHRRSSTRSADSNTSFARTTTSWHDRSFSSRARLSRMPRVTFFVVFRCVDCSSCFPSLNSADCSLAPSSDSSVLTQVVESMCGIPSLLLGGKLEVSTGMDTYSRKIPLGVTAAICPVSLVEPVRVAAALTDAKVYSSTSPP